MGNAITAKEEEEIVPAPEEKKAEATPAAQAASTAAPAQSAPAALAASVDTDALAAKVVTMLTGSARAAEQKQAAQPASTPDPNAGLSEEQRDMLKDAEFAEAEYGRTGLVQEHREYFSKVKAWAERNRPDGIADGDEEFERFKASVMPKLPAKRDDIKIERKANEAARKILDRERAERQKADQEAGKLKTEEQITARASEIETKARERVKAAADSALNDLPSESVAELAEEVVAPIAKGLAAQIMQLERVFNGLSCNDPAAQQRLRGNIAVMAREFSSKPESVVDGKRFIDPVEFGKMTSANQDTSGYWTWDQSQIRSKLEEKAAEISQVKAKKLSDTVRKAAQSIAGVRKPSTDVIFSPRIHGSPKPSSDAAGKRNLTAEERYFASLK